MSFLSDCVVRTRVGAAMVMDSWSNGLCLSLPRLQHFNCVDQQKDMSQEEVDRDQLCLSGWPPERVAGL